MSLPTADTAGHSFPTPVVIVNAADRKKGSINLAGSCLCKRLTYNLRLETLDDARTSLCHCKGCKKSFGGAFGLLAKVPLQCFRYTRESAAPVVFVSTDDGRNVHREFCGKCGSPICYYSNGSKDHFRHVAVGTLDDSTMLEPKGEFYCKEREEWLPQIPGLPRVQKIRE